MNSYGYPAWTVEAAFYDGPGVLPDDAEWTDLTDHAMSFDIRRGRGSQFDQPQAAQATVKFRNDDGALSPSTSWEAAVQAESPAGWWRFEDTSGAFTDSSGHGYNLSNSGTSTYQWGVNPATGSQSINMSAAGGSRAFTAALMPADITVMVWVWWDSIAISGIAEADGSWFVGSFNGIDIVASTAEGGGTTLTLPEAPSLDAWHHLAWTNDGSTGTVYLDGVEVVSGAQTYAASGGQFYAGRASTGQTHDGALDELVVLDHVLSSGEVRAFASGITVPVGAQVRIRGSHYRARVNADQPAGYWLLDETSGTSAADDSGHGRTGTHTSGPTVGQTSLLALESGQDGQQPYVRRSVKYDGTNDYTEVAYNAAWSPNTDAFTVHLLANFTAAGAGTERNLISKSDSTSTDWHLMVNSSNELDFQFIDVGGVIGVRAFTAFTPTVGRTYHIAGTWDGDTLSLYVDGVLVDSEANVSYTPRDSSGRPLRFGRTKNVYGFNGRLDEVAVVQQCIPAVGIAELAEMALTGSCLFLGYAEQWPATWEGQEVGFSTVTAYDALAQLAAVDLPLDDWSKWTLAERPNAYWRLDDREGSAVAADETGRYPAPVSHDSAGLTDDGIVWEFDQPPAVGDGSAAVFVGALLEPARAALPTGTHEFTIEAWMSIASGTTSTRYLLVAQNAASTNTDVIVQVATTAATESMTVTGTVDGNLSVGGSNVTWTGNTTTAGTDQWVHIFFARHIVGSTETLILLVNGTTLLGSWPDYAVDVLDSTRLFIGAESDLVAHNLSGDIVDEFAIYSRAVAPRVIGDQRPDQTVNWAVHRAEWGLTRWRGDLPSERISRILDLARWPYDANGQLIDVDATDKVPLAAPNSGSALAHCQDAATTNGSIFYSHNGRFHLADPSRSVRYRFTDDGTALSYRDLEVANDNQYVYTTAEVRDATDRTYVAVDDNAAVQYGRRRWTGDLLTDQANVAQAWADWQIHRFSRPHVRIDALTCKSFGEAAAAMLWQPGERVQVSRTDGDFQIDPELYVDELRISAEATSRKFEVQLSFSPAEVDDGAFILDESLLDSGDVLAYA